MAVSLGSFGDSIINETININSDANLITLEDGRVYLKGGVNETNVSAYPDATQGGAYSGTSFSVASQATAIREVVWDGTHLWVLDDNTDRVYKYNASGVYQNVNFYIGAEDIDPTGLTWDGTSFWVIGAISDRFYKYNASGVYQGSSISVAAQDTTPRGISWDGSAFWVSGDSSNAAYKYQIQIGVDSQGGIADGNQNYVRIK